MLLSQEARTLIDALFQVHHNALNHTIQKFEDRWGDLQTPMKQLEEVFEGVWERQEHFEQRILKIITEALK